MLVLEKTSEKTICCKKFNEALMLFHQGYDNHRLGILENCEDTKNIAKETMLKGLNILDIDPEHIKQVFG